MLDVVAAVVSSTRCAIVAATVIGRRRCCFRERWSEEEC